MNAPADSFRLTATAQHFARYASTVLANGCHSTASALRGTEPVLTLVAGLMDRTPGDVSRPAAIASWAELDCFNGSVWLNETPVQAETFRDYAQTLDMCEGTLQTSYTWTAGAKAIRVDVTTLVSQADFHLAATRLILKPEFTGMIRLRCPLRAWPAPERRLPLAQLSWVELKDALIRGGATHRLDPSAARPSAPPPEILTWFDLQEALAAEGLALTLPDPFAPTRAAVWYPGEVTMTAGARLDELLLTVEGAARGGSGFAEAVAIELTPAPSLRRSRVVQARRETGGAIELEAEVQAGQTYVVTKYASISRDGWESGLAQDVARVRAARAEGFERLAGRHAAAWRMLWTTDIIVEGNPELQRAVHSDLYYLLAHTNPVVSWPVGACGLSPNYFGHVFWDSDSWVFPVLLLLHPERARHVVAFRSRTLPWARANAARRGLAGAAFPWEADPETGTEETPRYAGVNAEREIHLQGDIAIAQWQYYLATGDLAWLREHGNAVIEAAADFYAARAAYNRDRDRYELLNVVSVDEKYTAVDNDAYTNAVAWAALEIAVSAAETLGLSPHPAWEQVSSTLAPLVSAERRHLIFDPSVPHDRQTWMAGALAMLTAPSLDLPMPADVRRNNYAYAVQKVRELTVEPNQMLLGMLAVHAATLGDAEAAVRWLQPTGHEFLKPPFNMRSETPHNHTVPHLAASCGILQALIYGFTGLRISEAGLIAAYPPVLPDAWEALTLRGIRFRGAIFDVVARRDRSGQVRLDRRPG